MATKYVSCTASNGYPIGNDANDGSTKALAKLTIDSAISAASAGDTIMINDGTYVENSAGNGWLVVNKFLTISAENDYKAIIRSSGTNRVIYNNTAGAGTMTWNKVVIDGEGNTAAGYTTNANATLHSLVFNGTKFIDTTSNLCAISHVNINLTATDCILSSSAITDYAFATSGWITTGSVTISGLTVNIAGMTSSVSYGIYIPSQGIEATGPTCSIKNCNVTINNTSSVSCYAIYTFQCQNVDISGNSVYMYGAGSLQGIRHDGYAAGVNCNRAKIYNNNVYYYGTAGGIMILLGSDGYVANSRNTANYCMVYNNYVEQVTRTSTTAVHGIMISWQTGGIMYGNISKNLGINYLLKGTQGTTICCGNLAIGNFDSSGSNYFLYAKGSTGGIFANNTCYLEKNSSACSLFTAASNSAGISVDSTGVIVKNNIFFCDIAPSGHVYVANSNTATFSNNLYYLNGVSIEANAFYYQGSIYATTALWSAAYETTLYTVDPKFITDRASLTPLKLDPNTSPAYHAGVYINNELRDYRGRPYYVTPTLGAYEFTSRDLCKTRTKIS